MDEILAEASYYSMFDERKVLIVKNANCFASDKISEENSNKLLNYLANPNDLTSLIFTTNAKIVVSGKATNHKESISIFAPFTVSPPERKIPTMKTYAMFLIGSSSA